MYKTVRDKSPDKTFCPAHLCRHVGTILHISAGQKGKKGGFCPEHAGQKVREENSIKDYINFKKHYC